MASEWEDFVASVNAWNAQCRAYKKRKKQPDALAVVRPFAKPLSGWNYHTKVKAVSELLEEEERRRVEEGDPRFDE